jgi:hypothetical protein
MKISILVIHIVLPMIASIGLYCYAFISTRWSYMDKNVILQHNLTNKQHDNIQSNNNTVKLDRQLIRHAFRSRNGLFGYCLDYKWLNLFTIKPEINPEEKSNSILFSNECRKSLPTMKLCDNIPDCPSYSDEEGCSRPYNSTRYYWKPENCIWESILFDYHDISRYLSSSKSHDAHHYIKRIRYYTMLLLFVSAPLLTFMALLILFCVNCIDRFYSIPFGFISLFSLTSFLSGSGGLGLFLYEWIQERLHRADLTHDLTQSDTLILALNPWIINVEHLGLAFWIVIAAIGTSLFTTILSCCFCCGLQSDKSKLRIHVNSGKYAIIHASPYDE